MEINTVNKKECYFKKPESFAKEEKDESLRRNLKLGTKSVVSR